jgi:hypothetical protein
MVIWSNDMKTILVHYIKVEAKNGYSNEVKGLSKAAWSRIVNNFNRDAEKTISKPQLHSQWNLMRKKYRGLRAIRESGLFGWDEEKMLPIGSEQTWAQYLADNKEVRQLRYQVFVHYFDLEEIFTDGLPDVLPDLQTDLENHRNASILAGEDDADIGEDGAPTDSTSEKRSSVGTSGGRSSKKHRLEGTPNQDGVGSSASKFKKSYVDDAVAYFNTNHAETFSVDQRIDFKAYMVENPAKAELYLKYLSVDEQREFITRVLTPK